MMSDDVSIRDAVRAYQKRKDALVGSWQDLGEHGKIANKDEQRLVMLHLDVDVDELSDLATDAGEAMIDAVLAGLDPSSAARGLWADGVVTGIMLEKMRRGNL